MAKVDLRKGRVRLEGNDVATVALMAGLAAAMPDGKTAPECAEAAVTLYKAVIKEIFAANDVLSEPAVDLLVEIWAALPEEDTDKPLGEDLTTRLAAFLQEQGRLGDGEYGLDQAAIP